MATQVRTSIALRRAQCYAFPARALTQSFRACLIKPINQWCLLFEIEQPICEAHAVYYERFRRSQPINYDDVRNSSGWAAVEPIILAQSPFLCPFIFGLKCNYDRRFARNVIRFVVSVVAAAHSSMWLATTERRDADATKGNVFLSGLFPHFGRLCSEVTRLIRCTPPTSRIYAARTLMAM
eukprot:scaffold18220_cov16-Prasinocladus_malaysianus.AAC.1